ncbi:MAG: hypothetical protein ACI83P_001973 [Janthinobacterium sp.]|jgi:hypothetical protein
MYILLEKFLCGNICTNTINLHQEKDLCNIKITSVYLYINDCLLYTTIYLGKQIDEVTALLFRQWFNKGVARIEWEDSGLDGAILNFALSVIRLLLPC